jgi:hypothetical protein
MVVALFCVPYQILLAYPASAAFSGVVYSYYAFATTFLFGTLVGVRREVAKCSN